jgi:hypothetical protein
LALFPLAWALPYHGKRTKAMFTKFFFQRLNPGKQLQMLHKKGILVGNRMRNSTKVSIYMLSDFFVEVAFPKNNNLEMPEQIRIFPSLESLNYYLEEDARLNLK